MCRPAVPPARPPHLAKASRTSLRGGCCRAATNMPSHSARCLLKLSLLLLGGMQCCRGVRDIHNDVDMMPGWMGSDYESPTYTAAGNNPVRRIEVLNEDARVYMVRGFLSPEECDALRKGAEPRLERSGVRKVDVSKKVDEVVFPEYRTSFNMFFARGENDVVKAVEERIAAWSLLPVSHGESMQVLRYEEGQKYDAHMDYLYYAGGNDNGGPRGATVLAYLADVEEGGETYFPHLPPHPKQEANVSECAKNHLAIKPRKGDAILFHSIAPSGLVDTRLLHGSCPVLKGEKWALTKWIHVGKWN